MLKEAFNVFDTFALDDGCGGVGGGPNGGEGFRLCFAHLCEGFVHP